MSMRWSVRPTGCTLHLYSSLLFVLLVVLCLVLLRVLLALADDQLAKFMHHFVRRRSARLRETQVIVCLLSSQRDTIFNAILSDNGYNFFHNTLPFGLLSCSLRLDA